MTEARPRRVMHLDTGRDWRGGQAQVLMLMQGLERRAVECFLLAPPGPLLDRARSAGLAGEPWPARGDWDVPASLAAFAAMRRLEPDVVHCHSARAHALGVPAARLARVPAVVVSRRVALPVGRGLAGLKYRMPVDRYLCVSGGVLDAMRAGGVPEDRLARVPSGIEGEMVPAPDLRDLLGVPNDAAVIGTAAALTAEKRHGDLLAAAPRVLQGAPGVHFAWAGDGPLRAALEAERDRRGLGHSVHLLGFRHDARALMAQCTIVVLPSALEGIATALIEAQAAGVPVVATAVGGVPEVVRDGVTGRLVPPGDPSALAEALVELLADPERRAAMGREARSAGREFHIDRTVERTLDEYRGILERRRSAA